MSEADILAKTYYDEMSVFRPKKEVIDGETIFLNAEEGEQVLEKVPCSLSSRSGGKISKDISFNKVESDYIVFISPVYEIKENDYIVLTVNIGVRREVYHLLAGKPRLFISHQEIPVNEVKKA